MNNCWILVGCTRVHIQLFFIRNLVFLTSLIEWVLRILEILSVWGKIYGILEGLEMKIVEEKLKI